MPPTGESRSGQLVKSVQLTKSKKTTKGVNDPTGAPSQQETRGSLFLFDYSQM